MSETVQQDKKAESTQDKKAKRSNRTKISKKCHNCGEDGQFSCSSCRLRRYCGKECQKTNWKAHKNECFNFDDLQEIFVELDRNGLIRHINGNTLDNRRQNLQRVSVIDAFKNRDWTVDAVCYLTDEQFETWQRARNF